MRRSSRAHRLALLAPLLAVLGSGCAPEDPYTSDRPDAPAQHQRAETHEPAVPPESGELSGRAPRELLDEPTQFPEAGETPQATLALAARLYGNWTSTTASRQLTRIAALAVGQARAELRQAAAQSTIDHQQRAARSRATVEAINVRGRGRRRQGLVVTRERVRGPDLPFEGWRYRVTLAAIERRANSWVVSRWMPQP